MQKKTTEVFNFFNKPVEGQLYVSAYGDIETYRFH